MRKTTNIISLILILLIIASAAVLIGDGSFVTRETAPTPSPTVIASPAPSASPKPVETPDPTPEPTPEYFTVSFIGDCTLASSQHIKGSAAAFETVVGEDYAFPFAKTAEYFKSDYLSIANLESTFTTSNSSNGATFTFKSDPVYANVLSEGGIDLVVLGNNHGSDYGTAGVEDTKKALDDVGVSYAGEDDWYIFCRDGGIKIGVYSKLYPTKDSVLSGIEAMQEAGAEFIIVGLHWGLEGKYGVTADQESVGHAAIDAGASIVYGSHPHVLQRTEEYNGGYIFYSLGNWSFGGHTNPRDRDTAIIQAVIMREPDGTLSVTETSFIPCELSSASGYNNYQPVPYEEGSEGYERAMSKLLGAFTGPDLTIDYSAYHKNEQSGDNSDESTRSGGEVSSDPSLPAETTE